MSHRLTSRHWVGKASAGLVLGFAIALGTSGLLAWAVGARDTFMAPQGQLAMWFMSPVWCGVLSFCFLFRSGARAWAMLAIAAVAIWLALYATGWLS